MRLRTRWRCSATRWRLGSARVRVSNAWYRVAGRRIHMARQGYRNWLSGRARARGRDPLPDRLTRAAGSRMPVYRDRISPATGRPRRTDRSPADLARWRAARDQRHVREALAARQPQCARTIERAVRDLSPRAGRPR